MKFMPKRHYMRLWRGEIIQLLGRGRLSDPRLMKPSTR